MNKIIKQKGLEATVFLKGYTNDPTKVLQESAFSFLACFYEEGIAMTVFESVENGCPCFTYDVKYDPSEIIDKTGGRISKIRMNKSLVVEMIKEANNPDDRLKVKERAKEFSKQHFFDKWHGVAINRERKKGVILKNLLRKSCITKSIAPPSSFERQVE